MLRDEAERQRVIDFFAELGYTHAWVLTSTDLGEDLFMVPAEEAATGDETARQLKVVLPGRKVWVVPFEPGYQTVQLY